MAGNAGQAVFETAQKLEISCKEYSRLGLTMFLVLLNLSTPTKVEGCEAGIFFDKLNAPKAHTNNCP